MSMTPELLKEIDPGAVQLFREADWYWNPREVKFIECRQPGKESTAEYQSRTHRSIGFEKLRDNGLTVSASSAGREAGLILLRLSLGLGE